MELLYDLLKNLRVDLCVRLVINLDVQPSVFSNVKF